MYTGLRRVLFSLSVISLLCLSFAVYAEGGSKGVSTADQDYELRIKSLEEKINNLKEKIFRSKARIIMMQETVLHGVISGAKAVLNHQNEMGNAFRLISVNYSLDGAPIFNKIDVDGDLASKKEFEIFNGSIVPGNHNIMVSLVYKGYGFGIFSYLEGYKFRIRSNYTFLAEEGKITFINIVGYEKGNMLTTAMRDRPSVRFDREVRRDTTAKKAGGNS